MTTRWDFSFSTKNVSQEHYIFPLYAKRNDHTTFWTSMPSGPPYWMLLNLETGAHHTNSQWSSAVVLPSNRRLKLWQQIFIETKQNFRITVLIAFSRTSRVMMDEYADAKWNLPGWRIEQKYNTDVLIGNWNEERRVVGTLCMFGDYIFENSNIPLVISVCTMETIRLCKISWESYIRKLALINYK